MKRNKTIKKMSIIIKYRFGMISAILRKIRKINVSKAKNRIYILRNFNLFGFFLFIITPFKLNINTIILLSKLKFVVLHSSLQKKRSLTIIS